MYLLQAPNAQAHMTPESLIGQLIWRDFFYCVAAYTPNFTKMKDNPICLQIEWDENERMMEAWKHVSI